MILINIVGNTLSQKPWNIFTLYWRSHFHIRPLILNPRSTATVNFLPISYSFIYLFIGPLPLKAGEKCFIKCKTCFLWVTPQLSFRYFQFFHQYILELQRKFFITFGDGISVAQLIRLWNKSQKSSNQMYIHLFIHNLLRVIKIQSWIPDLSDICLINLINKK